MADNVYQTVMERRSIRRFKPQKIPYQLLEKCVNAGRVAPSAANLQPLEYIIVDNDELLQQIFPLVRFAGYLDWNPGPEEMPRAYIVILAREEKVNTKYDVGLAAENIVLTSLEEGVGSCLIRSFQEEKVRNILNIPPEYTIHLLIALGYPAEKPVCEELKTRDGSIKYWRDEKGTLHVPKRPLKDILHRNKFGE